MRGLKSGFQIFQDHFVRLCLSCSNQFINALVAADLLDHFPNDSLIREFPLLSNKFIMIRIHYLYNLKYVLFLVPLRIGHGLDEISRPTLYGVCYNYILTFLRRRGIKQSYSLPRQISLPKPWVLSWVLGLRLR